MFARLKGALENISSETINHCIQKKSYKMVNLYYEDIKTNMYLKISDSDLSTTSDSDSSDF